MTGADDAMAARIVAAARGWLGTPYQHQASAKGAGADCLGLVRGVWRELRGTEPETPPPYTPDWSEASGREVLFEAAARHLARVPIPEARPGDVLLFRMRRTGPAKHLGILSAVGAGEPRMIHAYSGRGVVENSLGPSWRRRVAAAFRFPR
ncbi:NlpC/P60 family protein [Rhodovulum sp. DZ06]|uniref:NlpC/P60 family protein n=1 Tax=Rhodovulum sp. DZ06 TaxID=3425126 RepID=UPI003D34B498